MCHANRSQIFMSVFYGYTKQHISILMETKKYLNLAMAGRWLSVKSACSASKCEDLRSHPQDPHKSQMPSRNIIIPALLQQGDGQQRQENPRSSWASCLCIHSGKTAETLSQTRWKVKDDTRGFPLTSIHVLGHVCACIHTHKCSSNTYLHTL